MLPAVAFAKATADLGRGWAFRSADISPAGPPEVSCAEIAMLNAVLSHLAAGRAPGMEAAR